MRVEFPNSPHAPLEVVDGQNLSEVLTVQNSPILFGCRTGICGTCLIEVEGEQMIPPSPDEQELLEIIAPDNPKARLACQLKCQGAIRCRYLGV